VTIQQGTNKLVVRDKASILSAARQALAARMVPVKLPYLWDGKAAVRIAHVLGQELGISRESLLVTYYPLSSPRTSDS